MATYTFVSTFGAQNWASPFSWDVSPIPPGAADNVFISNSGTVGTPCIVDSSQAANTVTISRGNALNVQAGGVLAVGGQLSLGNVSGVSQLNVFGAVSAANLLIGQTSGGQGLVTVSLGTLTITGNIEVGRLAASTLQVSTLGTVSCNFMFVGNSANAVDGRLVIGGAEFGAAGLGGAVNATGGITLETAGSKLIFNTIDNRVFGSRISDIGSVEIKGSASVRLDNLGNNYTGATTVISGILQAGNAGALSSGSAFTVNSGARLDLNGYNNTVLSLSGAGIVENTDVTFQSDLSLSGGNFSGVIQNPGAAAVNLVKTGGGVFYLSGNGNSYTGTTVINGGILALGAGGAAGSIGAGALTVNAGATFSLFKTGDFTFGNSVSGAGAFDKNLAGTVTLTGNMDGHTGLTRVAGGTLKGGAANVFGANNAVNIFAGANLDLGGFSQAIGALSGAGNIINSGAGATLTESNAATTLFSGIISGAVGLTKAGVGTLQLSGVNTYTLNTNVGAGVLALTGAGSIANSALASVSSGGALDLAGLSGGGATINNLSLSGTGELRLGGKLLTVALAENSAGPGGTIVGSALVDSIHFVLNSVSFSLAATSFSGWTDGVDQVTITGSFVGDTITGSSRADMIIGNAGEDFLDGGGGNDTIDGGNAKDTMFGGNGDDSFVYVAGADLVAGEGIDGGAGTGDVIVIRTNFQNYDLRQATVTGVENLRIESISAVTLSGAQIGAGAITQVIGNAINTNVLRVNGALVNLTGVTFTSWSAGQDYIQISGTGGADSLTGSDQADDIIGYAGADAMAGGAGNDIFHYQSDLELAAGETVSGGAGALDQISLDAVGNFNFSLAVISGVEQLRFNSGAGGTASLSGTQIGAGLITSVLGDAVGVETLNVSGASVSLNGVTFTSWTDGTDVINLNGTAGVDNLVGSAQRDIISAGALNDFLYGNNGNDELYGGDGADYMSGGNGADYMSGGEGVETFFGGAGVDTIIGGGGDDLFYILAGDGGDIIVEYTGQGNDRILSAISYSLSSGSEIETLSTDANVGTVDINLTGNTLNNVIIGNNGVNILDGGLGNDTLYGLGGSVDYFTFSTIANTSTNSDTIADWSSAGDLIFLDDAAFTGMAAGTLAATAFLSGAGLTSAATLAQRVIVNTTNGDLWWDQDGVGGIASVRFASVGAAHPVFNYDFFGI